MSGGQGYRGRGNVFADLELPDPEGALVRAELAFQINAAIEANGWSDALAAQHLKLTASQLAGLRRGRLAEFTTDDLFHLLNEMNIDVDITLEPNVSPDRAARIAVQGHTIPLAASPKSGRQEVMRFD
ncbi:MAG: helix-turn-helix domain-containing protein [Chloroflexota bacterium]|nr:helix-turn-helix domain-containing protein [Chloroflexota bacterium]